MREDDFVNTMLSFVGITENPPGSNRTPIGVEYGWNGVAWCAETISVACHRLGFPLHEAAVIRIEEHAKSGDWGMGWSPVPVRGAATIFDFGGRGRPGEMHTGAVVDVLPKSQFRNCEGNHRDRCDVVLRDMKFVRGFATFPFDGISKPPPHTTQHTTVGSDLTEKLMEAPVLKQGSTDKHHVGILQSLLTWHAGDLTGDKNRFVDGEFGPLTTHVLMTWQSRTKTLEADGVAGPKTWAWLCGV